MIVCSCQRITDRDIHAAIDWMRAADPMVLITPGKVYRALGKSAECGGCIALFVANMRLNANLAATRDSATGPILPGSQDRDFAHEGRSGRN
jgi:bacterioferritin-associated ferredoxin